MHYKDGQEAKLYDSIRVSVYGVEIIGILVNITPGATSCNGIVSFTKAQPCMSYHEKELPTLSHCYVAMATDICTIGQAELVHRIPELR